MRSAGNPSAHRRRVAATSPYTSPFSTPYFTFNSSSLPMTQVNFGVAPPIALSRYWQVTSWFGANAPGPVGPALRSIEATVVGAQTCARRIAASRRALDDNLDDEEDWAPAAAG